MTSYQIGVAGAVYVAGACIGALFFGQLTDRFGRKKLFLITLGVYTVATVLDGLLDEPDVVLRRPVPHRRRHRRGVRRHQLRHRRADPGEVPRPRRHRDQRLVLDRCGRWSAAHHPAARPDARRPGAGLAARLRARRDPRRRHPAGPSPRAGEPALAVHPRPRGRGRGDRPRHRATVVDETGKELPSVTETITIRQRKTIGIAEIAKTVFTLYPRRTILCFSLFVGQAFLYNAFFFTYGDTLTHVLRREADRLVHRRLRASATSLGALLLSPLFDRVGRVRMIAGTYILSGVLLGSRRRRARRPRPPSP